MKNVRPLGAPTGVFVDAAGRLFVVEDRNRTLLMLTRDDAAPGAAASAAKTMR